jgi:hypothetical protein
MDELSLESGHDRGRLIVNGDIALFFFVEADVG